MLIDNFWLLTFGNVSMFKVSKSPDNMFWIKLLDNRARVCMIYVCFVILHFITIGLFRVAIPPSTHTNTDEMLRYLDSICLSWTVIVFRDLWSQTYLQAENDPNQRRENTISRVTSNKYIRLCRSVNGILYCPLYKLKLLVLCISL